MSPKKRQPHDVIRPYVQREDYAGWFDALYANADGDANLVPWARMSVFPEFAAWIEERNLTGAGKSALVVGSGLGDDAEALAQIGFAVTAFDLSPTAIEWSRKRFPQSKVTYQVGDLFDLPDEWIGAFDFTLEIRTVQSLPPRMQADGLKQLARPVALDGTLWIFCIARNPNEDAGGPPWPIARDTLDGITAHGLEQVARHETLLRRDPSVWSQRQAYHRPE